MVIFWIILGVLGLIVVWLIAVYNGLITLRNRTDEAWSDIDVQLKRRYDLIPNLVETIKGYAGHEKEVFEKVTLARTAAINAEKGGIPAEIGKAENMLAGALKTLFAVAENYPDLKASQNFLQLQDELSDTENKIQASRRFYNGNVRDFNTKREQFPTNLVAGMFGFKSKEFFEVEEPKEREAVKVQF
ncbi:MAG: LemA family protein [Candidatus Moranbacteria bacterium]|nr:LemA family protein [Candidatus Moranbacteria bacterium]